MTAWEGGRLRLPERLPGGGWHAEGYRSVLERIRRASPGGAGMQGLVWRLLPGGSRSIRIKREAIQGGIVSGA